MKIKIIVCIVLLGIVVLAGAISCSQGDIQVEYDILAAQFEEANEQLDELQGKMFEAQILQTQYDELMVQYDELTDQNDTNLDEIASLEAQIGELENDLDELADEIEVKTNEIADCVFNYDELKAQYDELKAQYDALLGSAMEITEENIEQALFALVNQERKNNGLNELAPGPNLQNWSRTNSQRMYVSKQTEYYDDMWIPFQRVYIAVGYNSLDQVVNAAMTFWQSHALSYENNILDEDALYSAVGVVKSGDICYITFMASNYP